MANIKSAQKRIRRDARRTEINGSRMSRIRTFIKKVVVAIEAGDAKAAEEAYRKAQPEVMRGVTKNLMHANTASRKLSRLSQRIKAIKSA